MAQQDFGMGTYGTGHLSVNENWNTSTQVSYHVRLWCTTGDSAFDHGPGPSWSGNAGGVGGSGAWTYNGNGDHVVWEFDWTYNKDANGYGTWNFSGSMNGDNPPYVTSGGTSFNMSPGRIGIAPSFSSLIADTITPTSARLGVEISSVGLGTSANMNMYIRLQGTGGWTDLGNQGDAAGYNYWTATGLQPGRVYEYYSSCWNNNGDGASTGVQSFTAQPVSGMMAVMKAII